MLPALVTLLSHVCVCAWLFVCGCVTVWLCAWVCVYVRVRDPQLKGARTAAAAASMRMTAKAAQLSAQVTTLQAEHDALETAKARLADKLREEQRRCAAAEAEVSSLRDAAAASDRVDKAAAGSRTAAASAADEVADLKRQLQQAQEALRASNEATAAVQHRHERALRLAAQQRDRAVQDAEASEKRAQKAKEEVRSALLLCGVSGSVPWLTHRWCGRCRVFRSESCVPSPWTSARSCQQLSPCRHNCVPRWKSKASWCVLVHVVLATGLAGGMHSCTRYADACTSWTRCPKSWSRCAPRVARVVECDAAAGLALEQEQAARHP